jgi:hypothetical protein
MVEMVARAMADSNIVDEDLANLDPSLPHIAERWQALARAAISAMQSDPIPIYKTEPDPKPIRDLAVRDVEE